MSAPKFTQIKQYIFSQIESGQWAEHQKVPSENVLASLFNVSRMTARRALQELTDEGVLNRSKGSGTFVSSFKSQSSLLEIRNISEEITELGNTYSAELIGITTLPANANIAAELDIEEGNSIYFSEILHKQNGQALQLEQRYVNATLVPDYISQDFTLFTPHEYLSKEAPLTEATHQIEAVLASNDIVERLNIRKEQPCLQVKRRTWSRTGVVSLAILTSPGDLYRLGGHCKF